MKRSALAWQLKAAAAALVEVTGSLRTYVMLFAEKEGLFWSSVVRLVKYKVPETSSR